ncbi:MAPK kinase substrate protein At1g80180-like [Chenopodium quinoa]|uniref:MAPK kinase substrate protein At1g80180-like n=1 Tax=Chenopodium quinoa TaxID=63459 RepID=UPI000B77E5EA|nr:MAPK kinase substrate protein At1g80180-like [Chenopodium quinoa]
MEGLQRSAISFRRQGSSGLVWDDKLVQAELAKEKSDGGDGISVDQKDDDQKPDFRRSKSDGGNRRAYRTVKVEQAEDPPSPRLSACGFCSVFGKPAKNNKNNKIDKKKSGKPKHK